ncbi:MAG: bifunctional phosphoribosylaminoimidazolecarboxamide formyltransferase/IMP cyclohydrolase [Deltaproteobacteria bacterium]|nr:bifunctional phosphoribosylaminoimidazolecarboxamide formyltransferase/IMP cyclohydrolase [Deltaproteobacteria bacterium]
MKKIKRAIISVTNKDGIKEFATKLSEMGVEIISTGGTAKLLSDGGVDVIAINDVTGFPEMMDGRIKTLHPKIHGGILAVRDNADHVKKMDEFDITPIDMVVVNLYAFEETIKDGATFEEAIENIDIGGPTMIRAAAKNHNDVACVTDPADYDAVISEMEANDGSLSSETRLGFAKKTFQLTARYDGAISNYLGTLNNESEKREENEKFPETYTFQVSKVSGLRYGENPHQGAAFYTNSSPEEKTLATAKQHQGKELSFNNILDLNAAVNIAAEFQEPAAVIIKHNNPCGVAMTNNGLLDAFERALTTDSKSAFGGIVGLNGKVTEELATRLTGIFLEAIVAPSFEDSALEIFKKKKNLRVIETGGLPLHKSGLDIKTVWGGLLLQDLDFASASDLKTVTKREPTENELTNLLFAWNVAKHVKSNTIVLTKSGQTIGIGAGQMSRIDSTNIAVMKANDSGLEVKGTVMASDAFFPFPDNVEMASTHGITAIIQPGGSIKDEEVIKAADEHNIAMVFTGIRHFRH